MHPAPIPAPEVPASEEDIEMEEDDGDETPHKTRARKRAAVQSPTVERNNTRRRRVSSIGESVVVVTDPVCPTSTPPDFGLIVI